MAATGPVPLTGTNPGSPCTLNATGPLLPILSLSLYKARSPLYKSKWIHFTLDSSLLQMKICPDHFSQRPACLSLLVEHKTMPPTALQLSVALHPLQTHLCWLPGMGGPTLPPAGLLGIPSNGQMLLRFLCSCPPYLFIYMILLVYSLKHIHRLINDHLSRSPTQMPCPTSVKLHQQLQPPNP